MPFKVEGNNLMHFKNGRWSVKQTAKNHENAVKAMRLLEGLEHGMIKRVGILKKKKND